MHPENSIPPGLCQCGCGAKTNIWKRDRGKVVARYLIGHHRRKTSERIRVDSETGCHVWQGALSTAGYGATTVSGNQVLTHRYYYEQRYGPIPGGLDIDHLCRNPACCNPDHLEPVTHAENMRRGKNTILTTSSARAIKASGEHPTVLAERYGISVTMIYNIRSGKKWRDV